MSFNVKLQVHKQPQVLFLLFSTTATWVVFLVLNNEGVNDVMNEVLNELIPIKHKKRQQQWSEYVWKLPGRIAF